ncbi:MAG: radical SAM protein, partial [Planctomycetia bacterium]|nr:radical SAM protein [Planctomycetia bacterium]
MSEHSFKIVTFGCKVNQYEGQALRQGLLDAGLSEDAAGAQPTVVVVNTCCVTAEAARQSRQAVRKGLRDSGGPRVYVTGCYAHRAACDDALGAIEGLAGIDADKSALLESIADETGCAVAAAEAQPITEFGGHTRAFVKVQDGCDAACSYCIVWRVRPDLRSRLPEEVAEEVRRLSQKHREIVLCGIHLGKYGVDLEGRDDLAGLVAALLDVREVGRI